MIGKLQPYKNIFWIFLLVTSLTLNSWILLSQPIARFQPVCWNDGYERLRLPNNGSFLWVVAETLQDFGEPFAELLLGWPWTNFVPRWLYEPEGWIVSVTWPTRLSDAKLYGLTYQAATRFANSKRFDEDGNDLFERGLVPGFERGYLSCGALRVMMTHERLPNFMER